MKKFSFIVVFSFTVATMPVDTFLFTLIYSWTVVFVSPA